MPDVIGRVTAALEARWHEETTGPEADMLKRDADAVLAALGLDDFDAAVKRGSSNGRRCSQTMARNVLEAALSPTDRSQDA